MYNEKMLLMISNDEKVALVPHPARFGYPPKKTLRTKNKDITWYDTGRERTTFDYGTARIYTEANSTVDLDKFAVDLTDISKES